MQYVIHLFDIGGIHYFICVVIAIVVLLGTRAFKFSWDKSIAAALATAYMFIVLTITVFKRGPTDLPKNYFPPFWAYGMIISKSKIARDLVIQIIMNVIMLAPLGFLIPFFVEKKPILVGIACSITIELIQLVTKKGYFEIDDIIHNTIGVILGYLIYKVFRIMISGRKDSC